MADKLSEKSVVVARNPASESSLFLISLGKAKVTFHLDSYDNNKRDTAK